MIGWFRKRREAREQFERDLSLSESAPRLHGVNLLEWQYLGRTVLTYVNEKNVPTAKATLFAFCGVDDTDDRHFILIPHQAHTNFDHHTYVIEHAALWEIGERNLWDVVGAEPSQWLREYMFEKFGEVWNSDTNWWVKDGQASPPRKKSKLKLVEPPGDENNVVRVEFGHKGNDDGAKI